MSVLFPTAIEQALGDIGRSQKMSVRLQFMQTSILMQMNGTLQSINSEMAEVKKLQKEALAIQQELLTRERLQTYLEEFIYQAQKLVAECKADSDMIPSTRFFLLRGLIRYVERQGIATPIIRGMDNKASFEKAIDDATMTAGKLYQMDEVKKAVAWAEEFHKRKSEEDERRMIAMEKEDRAIRRQEKELRDEQNKKAWRTAATIIGSIFAAVLAACGGCCVMGQLANLTNPERKK